jgi:nitrate reductase assembly molybdenum cofactor insertion protein NarJ
MNTTVVESARARELLSDAAEWKLLAMLLACPQGDWREHVTMLAREVSDVELQHAAREMVEEATEGLYHSTFGPGGPAAPREVSHRDYVTPGAALSELVAYYEAFAFSPATDEPPDHVSIECDFLAYLRVKEAYALVRGDEQQAAIAADAAQHFQQDHLATLARPLQASLAASGIEYLQRAGRVLLQRVGPAPAAGPALGASLAILEDDAPDCCGAYGEYLAADSASDSLG